MKLTERISELAGNRYTALIIGAVGGLLVLCSTLMPDGTPDESVVNEIRQQQYDSEDYCRDTEQRLEEFLSRIEGAGKVRVLLRVSDSGMSVYACEDRTSESADRKEVEEKYVMVSEGGGGRGGLLETVQEPEISGTVVICTGGASPAVQERIYNALEALLGLPAGRIYVTKME